VSDIAAAASVAAPSAPPASPSSEHLGRAMWSHGSFSFKDLIDIVNPLQHLPVVGSIYRYLTGDEPAVGTRVIGDALYGGPIGFGVSVVANALLTNDSGQDLGERLLADVFGPRDHDSPSLGTPQVATADGQPPTPSPAHQVAATERAVASAAAALPARSIASASAPMSLAAPTTAAQQSSSQSLAPMSPRPVAMNQLFRSAPAASATPEQAFMSQASQFQRQVRQGRGTNGAVLNNRPVPLELSNSLMPVMPAGGHLAVGSGAAADPGKAADSASQAQGSNPAASPNTIAQKMLDALSKYEQLKRQEEQKDSASKADQVKLDLAL